MENHILNNEIGVNDYIIVMGIGDTSALIQQVRLVDEKIKLLTTLC